MTSQRACWKRGLTFFKFAFFVGVSQASYSFSFCKSWLFFLEFVFFLWGGFPGFLFRVFLGLWTRWDTIRSLSFSLCLSAPLSVLTLSLSLLDYEVGEIRLNLPLTHSLSLSLTLGLWTRWNTIKIDNWLQKCLNRYLITKLLCLSSICLCRVGVSYIYT